MSTDNRGDGRDNKGRFAPGDGNSGRPKGSLSMEKRAFAEACRAALGEIMAPHTLALFQPALDYDARALAVRQRFVEWLADRGFGTAPKDVEDQGSGGLDEMLDQIREMRNMESAEAQAAGTAVAVQAEREA